MRIIRTRHERDFTILGNALLRDERLSFRARGVLAYLLSMKDGWSVDASKIAARGREGRDAIRTALNELEDAGYLQRQRVKSSESGLWVTEAVLADRPELEIRGLESQVSLETHSLESQVSLETHSLETQSEGFSATDSQSLSEGHKKKNQDQRRGANRRDAELVEFAPPELVGDVRAVSPDRLTEDECQRIANGTMQRVRAALSEGRAPWGSGLPDAEIVQEARAVVEAIRERLHDRSGGPWPSRGTDHPVAAFLSFVDTELVGAEGGHRYFGTDGTPPGDRQSRPGTRAPSATKTGQAGPAVMTGSEFFHSAADRQRRSTS